jgi:hypothetical protein
MQNTIQDHFPMCPTIKSVNEKEFVATSCARDLFKASLSESVYVLFGEFPNILGQAPNDTFDPAQSNFSGRLAFQDRVTVLTSKVQQRNSGARGRR